MQIDTQDIIPFEGFELKWRFTEGKHNVLPAEDLSLIQPLSVDKAKELNRKSKLFIGNAALKKSEFTNILPLQIADHGRDVVEKWLKSLHTNTDARVVVSWDSINCALTVWEIFCKYWDDFCYPSSDDLLVLPASEEWVLYYCHHELFEYGKRKS